MSYSFHDRLRHTGNRLSEQSVLVTLRRGGHTTNAVPAFRILRRGEELLPGVSVTRLELQDFTIDAADYKFGGIAALPDVGDEIEIISTGEKFRVSSRGSNEPPYRFTTADRSRLRIGADRLTVS